MLHKFEKLTSIGKFREYQAKGQVAFDKLTLIYADNGGGKTTLTAVLRSLTSDQPEIVKHRKSVGVTNPQSVQITQKTGGLKTYHSFGKNGWSAPFPNIEIFDVHFVSENIYSGFEFNDTHKKQLHKFVIGEQGVKLQQQITKNKVDKKDSKNSIEKLQTKLITKVGNGLNQGGIGKFLKLDKSVHPKIDDKISTAQTALSNAQSNAVIQLLPTLKKLPKLAIKIEFDDLGTTLKKTTQTIQDDALKTLFKNHCKELSDSIENPSEWLETGFDYVTETQEKIDLEDIECPFCKREFGQSLDIIKAYTLQFDKEFKTLVSNIESHLTQLNALNWKTEIASLNAAKSANLEKNTSWKSHLPSTVEAPKFTILDEKTDVENLIQSAVNSVSKKRANPSTAISVAPALTLEAKLNEIDSAIDAYNEKVDTYNNAISNFKASILSESSAQANLDQLKRLKARFTTDIDSICSDLISENANLKNLQYEYPQLVKNQENAIESSLSDYGERLNYYLDDVFRTPFSVEKIEHVSPKGQAKESKIDYRFAMEGEELSFDPDLPKSVKDCLSEGDKSTIALAFFLAKLDIEPNLNKKILVFDDPLSSFDRNRRLKTVNLLSALLPNIEQLIVLSHNEHFLHDLSKPQAKAIKNSLQINYANNSAIIEPLTLESLVKNEYFKHLDDLELFLQHPDISKKITIIGWLRNVLESHIRFKFYRDLTISSDKQTFGNLIDDLNKQNVKFRDTNHAKVISDLRSINSISWQPHHGIPEPSAPPPDLFSMTVTELTDCIKDTFDLIDKRL